LLLVKVLLLRFQLPLELLALTLQLSRGLIETALLVDLKLLYLPAKLVQLDLLRAALGLHFLGDSPPLAFGLLAAAL